MSAKITKKRLWRRDPPVPNPYRDSLTQELGYKLDARNAGCLLIALAAGLLIVGGLAFMAYWFMH